MISCDVLYISVAPSLERSIYSVTIITENEKRSDPFWTKRKSFCVRLCGHTRAILTNSCRWLHPTFIRNNHTLFASRERNRDFFLRTHNMIRKPALWRRLSRKYRGEHNPEYSEYNLNTCTAFQRLGLFGFDQERSKNHGTRQSCNISALELVQTQGLLDVVESFRRLD